MTTNEYRLVVSRPEAHASGRSSYYFNKRDIEHARKGLVDHYDNEAHRMVVHAQSDAAITQAFHTWHAHIEMREISEWEITE